MSDSVEDFSAAIKRFIEAEMMNNHSGVELTDDFPLVENGVIDSLRIFVLIQHIDEELGVKLEPGDVVLDNFETLSTLSALVAERAV